MSANFVKGALSLIALFSLAAVGQEMVRVNIIAMYQDITTPPTTVEAAFQRVDCSGEAAVQRCTAEKFYQGDAAKIEQLKQRLQQLTAALSAPSVDMQNIDPEEIQRKMATMSQEEQIQYAMKLNQQMGLGPRAIPVEPPAVLAAIEEYNRLAAQVSRDLQNSSAIARQRMDMTRQREENHRDIDAWARSEEKKLPQVDLGEVGRGPDPRALHALRVTTIEKHIEAENQFLRKLGEFWPTYIRHWETYYGPFQKMMAAINYGADALNVENKQILVGGQEFTSGPLDDLLAFSREATENAARWELEKKNMASRQL